MSTIPPSSPKRSCLPNIENTTIPTHSSTSLSIKPSHIPFPTYSHPIHVSRSLPTTLPELTAALSSQSLSHSNDPSSDSDDHHSDHDLSDDDDDSQLVQATVDYQLGLLADSLLQQIHDLSEDALSSDNLSTSSSDEDLSDDDDDDDDDNIRHSYTFDCIDSDKHPPTFEEPTVSKDPPQVHSTSGLKLQSSNITSATKVLTPSFSAPTLLTAIQESSKVTTNASSPASSISDMPPQQYCTPFGHYSPPKLPIDLTLAAPRSSPLATCSLTPPTLTPSRDNLQKNVNSLPNQTKSSKSTSSPSSNVIEPNQYTAPFSTQLPPHRNAIITGYDVRDDWTNKKYAAYCVTVSCPNVFLDGETALGFKSWVVWKRYSDFSDLAGMLNKQFPFIKFPHFPPKRLFGSSVAEPFISSRLNKINRYLSFLFDDQKLRYNPHISDFFQFNSRDTVSLTPNTLSPGKSLISNAHTSITARLEQSIEHRYGLQCTQEPADLIPSTLEDSNPPHHFDQSTDTLSPTTSLNVPTHLFHQEQGLMFETGGDIEDPTIGNETLADAPESYNQSKKKRGLSQVKRHTTKIIRKVGRAYSNVETAVVAGITGHSSQTSGGNLPESRSNPLDSGKRQQPMFSLHAIDDNDIRIFGRQVKKESPAFVADDLKTQAKPRASVLFSLPGNENFITDFVDKGYLSDTATMESVIATPTTKQRLTSSSPAQLRGIGWLSRREESSDTEHNHLVFQRSISHSVATSPTLGPRAKRIVNAISTIPFLPLPLRGGVHSADSSSPVNVPSPLGGHQNTLDIPFQMSPSKINSTDTVDNAKLLAKELKRQDKAEKVARKSDAQKARKAAKIIKKAAIRAQVAAQLDYAEHQRKKDKHVRIDRDWQKKLRSTPNPLHLMAEPSGHNMNSDVPRRSSSPHPSMSKSPYQNTSTPVTAQLSGGRGYAAESSGLMLLSPPPIDHADVDTPSSNAMAALASIARKRRRHFNLPLIKLRDAVLGGLHDDPSDSIPAEHNNAMNPAGLFRRGIESLLLPHLATGQINMPDKPSPAAIGVADSINVTEHLQLPGPPPLTPGRIESVREQEMANNESITADQVSDQKGLKVPGVEEVSITHAKVCLDDFHLLKMIGKGTFGKVLLAKHRRTGKPCAIKIITKSVLKNHPNEIRHVMSERNVLMRNMKHPFLVGLQYAFQTHAKLYLVLDYVNGGELFFHLQRERRFPEDRVRFYAAEITSALEYLHGLGIMYRDLKPENILLDSDGHVALTDFGLAKENIEPAVGRTSTFCGTPEYLAPEIVKRQAYSLAVDWWCLGSVVYEMLVGLPPFYSANTRELFQRILHDKIRWPTHIPISSSVRAFVSSLLIRQPETRLGWSGANEVKHHIFFTGVNWDKLINKLYRPPFVPDLTSTLDLRYIDPTFKDEDICSKSMSVEQTGQVPEGANASSTTERWVLAHEARKMPKKGKKKLANEKNRIPKFGKKGAGNHLHPSVETGQTLPGKINMSTKKKIGKGFSGIDTKPSGNLNYSLSSSNSTGKSANSRLSLLKEGLLGSSDDDNVFAGFTYHGQGADDDVLNDLYGGSNPPSSSKRFSSVQIHKSDPSARETPISDTQPVSALSNTVDQNDDEPELSKSFFAGALGFR